jgi:hypothetical protein
MILNELFLAGIVIGERHPKVWRAALFLGDTYPQLIFK